MRQLARLARYEFRRIAAKHPAVFFPLYALADYNKRLMVTPDTDFVIEGYPRSGNTFAVVAFQHAQKRNIRLAHHLHAQAQIFRAVSLRIPTLVVIRQPDHAVKSLVIRHPHISVSLALRVYVEFYRTIAHLRSSFVIGLFDEVTTRFGSVIERVNQRFGTDFLPFSHTESNVADVFARIDRINTAADGGAEHMVARPTESKDQAKSRVALAEGTCHDLLEEARELYLTYTETAVDPAFRHS